MPPGLSFNLRGGARPPEAAGSLEPISEPMFMKCGSLRGTLHSVIAPFAGWAGPRGPPGPETREI